MALNLIKEAPPGGALCEADAGTRTPDPFITRDSKAPARGLVLEPFSPANAAVFGLRLLLPPGALKSPKSALMRPQSVLEMRPLRRQHLSPMEVRASDWPLSPPRGAETGSLRGRWLARAGHRRGRGRLDGCPCGAVGHRPSFQCRKRKRPAKSLDIASWPNTRIRNRPANMTRGTITLANFQSTLWLLSAWTNNETRLLRASSAAAASNSGSRHPRHFLTPHELAPVG